MTQHCGQTDHFYAFDSQRHSHKELEITNIGKQNISPARRCYCRLVKSSQGALLFKFPASAARTPAPWYLIRYPWAIGLNDRDVIYEKPAPFGLQTSQKLVIRKSFPDLKTLDRLEKTFEVWRAGQVPVLQKVNPLTYFSSSTVGKKSKLNNSSFLFNTDRIAPHRA